MLLQVAGEEEDGSSAIVLIEPVASPIPLLRPVLLASDRIQLDGGPATHFLVLVASERRAPIRLNVRRISEHGVEGFRARVETEQLAEMAGFLERQHLLRVGRWLRRHRAGSECASDQQAGDQEDAKARPRCDVYPPVVTVPSA
jgi:hypothetical protein